MSCARLREAAEINCFVVTDKLLIFAETADRPDRPSSKFLANLRQERT
jgi:hypothetical protein